jgi:hypothetical protein
MSAIDSSPPAPVRKSAQRMRWFLSVFEEQVARIEADSGNRFETDRGALATVFAEWLKAFEAQKPQRVEDKAGYVGFAAGLMLRSLIRHKPLRVVTRPEAADDNNPAFFWPEGYAYVAFCLNVRGLVIEQDFQGEQHVSDALEDVRTWWSFRENVADEPGLAIAFLDLFAGDDPDWSMPELFQSGRARELAHKFYDANEDPALG